RIIFSSPFRRLQNKTQVFPLPGSVFVHNRLTHSLEVASVGRSLGNILANKLVTSGEADGEKVQGIGSIVSAACLAHDMGNPSFGHSGEKAISRYFKEKEGSILKRQISDAQYADLTNFEGNANAFRILTHRFRGKGASGFALTYATLASIVKYPCESTVGGNKAKVHTKKYGYFDSEKGTYKTIAHELGIVQESENPMVYVRYPLVYLVEAADDICYNIIDLEDAHRLGILSHEMVRGLMLAFFEGNEKKDIEGKLDEIDDENDRIAYLRAKCIHKLIMAASDVFWEKRGAILAGTYNSSLTDDIPGPGLQALQAIQEISWKKIYNYSTVVEIEVAGYQIIGGLLEEFAPAILNSTSHYEKKLLALIPNQFHTDNTDPYSRVQCVVDFISGMTDLYAIEMYRKIKGISIPVLK
ncbi:MAG TPA: dNTP triphosphohydrolase, partial [Bacteroidia bacterium]|nr:dNTP triphosphohydrolase [Bacteroidia bacterium]